MMLSPFTLTSRSPAEPEEGTVSPRGTGGTWMSPRSPRAGFEQTKGSKRATPNPGESPGDSKAALSTPAPERKGRKEQEFQKKKKKKAE